MPLKFPAPLTLSSLVVLTLSAPAQALSLQEAWQRLESRSLSRQACALEAPRLQAERQQAARPSNPSLDLNAEDLGPAAGSSQNYHQWTLGLQQALPLNNRQALQKALGEQEVQASQARCARSLNRARLEVGYDYLEAVTAHEVWVLQQRRVVQLQTLLNGLEREINHGRLAPLNRMLPANELTRSQLAANVALQQWLLSQQKLTSHWGGQAHEAEALSWPQLSAPEGDPLNAEQTAETEAARLQLALAESKSIPDLTVGSALRWHPQSQDLGINAQLGWEIPLQPQQDGVRAAELHLEQLALFHREAQRQRLLERQHLEQMRASLHQQLTRYDQDLLPTAAGYLEQVSQGLLQGRLTVTQVLEARRHQLELEQERLHLRQQLARVELQLSLPGR